MQDRNCSIFQAIICLPLLLELLLGVWCFLSGVHCSPDQLRSRFDALRLGVVWADLHRVFCLPMAMLKFKVGDLVINSEKGDHIMKLSWAGKLLAASLGAGLLAEGLRRIAGSGSSEMECNCPHCGATATVPHAGRFNCWNCSNDFTVSAG